MIKNFEEVEREIRKLRDDLDALKEGDIDAKTRRIVNLAPSKDPNDAVIRAELYQFINESKKLAASTGSSTSSEEVCVFGAFINAPIQLRTNICPPHIVKRAGRFDRIYVTIQDPYVGGSMVIRLRKNEEYQTNLGPGSIIFDLEIPLKQDTYPVLVKLASEFTQNDNMSFQAGDIITLDTVIIGETYPGRGLLVKMAYK